MYFNPCITNETLKIYPTSRVYIHVYIQKFLK